MCSTSGRDLHPHLEAVAEARLLEPQVLLDVPQLVGQRHVRPLAGKRVADELRELGQELARLVGARVDRVRDRRERVVDEVGRDLGPQRPQLRARQQLALRLERRQRDLGADQAGRLLHDAHVLGPDPAGARVERAQAPHPPVLQRQRHDHRPAQRTAGLAAVEPGLDVDAVGLPAGVHAWRCRRPPRGTASPSPTKASTLLSSASAIAAAWVSSSRCGAARAGALGRQPAAQIGQRGAWRRAARPASRAPRGSARARACAAAGTPPRMTRRHRGRRRIRESHPRRREPSSPSSITRRRTVTARRTETTVRRIRTPVRRRPLADERRRP